MSKKEKHKYWILFDEDYCVLCGAVEIFRTRIYDRPKPKEWNERHIYSERACYSHFM